MANVNIGIKQAGFREIGSVVIPAIFYQRFNTGIVPFDELLGQGFLPGSTFTITGKAGAGKTTLLLQMLESLSTNGKMVGYASGEEAIEQIAFNAERLKVKKVQVANITDVDDLCIAIKSLDVLIIDSFQYLTCKESEKPLAVQRIAIQKLVAAAKANDCVIGIIQHLTSVGTAKGGTFIPHTVDMNMEIETCGDEGLKTLRVYKNRFGRVGEIQLMMTEHGFDFEHVVKPEESAKMNAAIKRGDSEKQQILEYIENNGKVTRGQIVKQIGESWKVDHFLRILTNEGVIKKAGRGKEAAWEKAA